MGIDFEELLGSLRMGHSWHKAHLLDAAAALWGAMGETSSAFSSTTNVFLRVDLGPLFVSVAARRFEKQEKEALRRFEKRGT